MKFLVALFLMGQFASLTFAEGYIPFLSAESNELIKNCQVCHSAKNGDPDILPADKSKKAKRKFNLDDFASLSKKQQAEMFDDALDEIKDGDMPPKKYLEKNPEHRVTKEQYSKLKDEFTSWQDKK